MSRVVAPLQEDDSRPPSKVAGQVYNEDQARVELVMECKCCMLTSAPRTPRQCSVITACSKHWKPQRFAQTPESMPGRVVHFTTDAVNRHLTAWRNLRF